MSFLTYIVIYYLWQLHLCSNQLRSQRLPGVYVLPAAKSPLSEYYIFKKLCWKFKVKLAKISKVWYDWNRVVKSSQLPAKITFLLASIGRLLWQLGRLLQNFLTTLILILIRNLVVKNMSEEEWRGPTLGVCFKRELTVNGHNRLPVHKTLINTTLNITKTEQYI